MRRAASVSALFVCYSIAACLQAQAQESASDGAKLFRSQCSTCHSLNADDPPRQGPNLAHVYGRKIGSVPGFAYTAGYRESEQSWGDDNLDAYLTSPQKMFPGSTMAYRQAKPEIRRQIIAYLKEQG